MHYTIVRDSLDLCEELSERLYELLGPEGGRRMTPVSAAGQWAS